jgi:hypothetical protein
MKLYSYLKVVLLVLSGFLLLTACHDDDDEEDKDALNPYVDTPANPFLVQEGSLHLFKIDTFFQDLADIDNDIMVLTFDNFTPASTNIEPDEDEDKTLNDLGWTQTSWDEDTTAWLQVSSPKSTAIHQKTRQYRILTADNLSAAHTTLNQPIYEAIKKNVYERQLAATFVWDLGNYTDDMGDDVSGEEIADYESFYGFELLEHASIWGDGLFFSNGATIYGATRSVAADTLVIESVDNGSSFSLAPTKLGAGIGDIETALDAYPQGVARLEYRFTVDYSTNSIVYISFDTSNDLAYIYTSSSGSTNFSVPYTIHTTPSYVELDTASLDDSQRFILNGLQPYFNPIIAGPYTADGTTSSEITDKAYYYGKHYIKTNEASRLTLKPLFFLDPTATSDVQNAFKTWRQERHIEEGK